MAKSLGYSLVSLGFLALILEGCGDFMSIESQTIGNAKISQASQKSTLKPGANINLKQPSAFYFSEPGIIDLSLQLESPLSSGVMKVDVYGGEGVELQVDQLRYEFVLSDGVIYSIPLQALISSNGRFYINLHITLERYQGVEKRVLAAVIHVGNAQVRSLKTESLSGSSISEVGVIELPAQETIGPGQ